MPSEWLTALCVRPEIVAVVAGRFVGAAAASCTTSPGSLSSRNHEAFVKNSFFWRQVTALFGTGLLTSEGEFWRRQRRFGREAAADREIGGYAVPRGTTIFVSPWLLHRDPRYFTDPLAFRPERWAGDLARSLPRFAYMPFGADSVSASTTGSR